MVTETAKMAFHQNYYVVFLISYFFNFCENFNIDLPSVFDFRGENNSMFGFTVAQYRYKDDNWILVGAPKAKDVYFSALDSSYVGGSVYRCNVTSRKQQCEPLDFSTAATNVLFKDEIISEQWLGATLLTSLASILVCAPRYYQTSSKEYPLLGTCFYSDDGFSSFIEYSLCRIKSDKKYDINFYAFCQAGFSAALPQDSNRLYFGAVGAYGWRGKLFSIDKSIRIKSYNYNDQNIRDDSFEVAKIRWNNPAFRVTEKYRGNTSSIFMGFSMTSLNLGKMAGVAAGTPRSRNCLGEVNVLTGDFRNMITLLGEQMGAYFGYSMATADVDGDGTDDLIIGAPMYSNYNKTAIENYETGRIYIYYQGNITCSKCDEKKFNKRDIIDGERSAGRFGLAIASLGDLDLDGYDDFAVGAPYEKMGNDVAYTGAVYIFYGSARGVAKYTQVIRASDVYHTNKALFSLNTFGFSISGGQDLDGNSYPDMVVGAYESDVVYFFRSRPVIKVIADLSFTSSDIINKRNCKIQNNNNNETVPCVSLQLCLRYIGINVRNEFTLAWNITLDVKRLDAPRMFFIDDVDKTNILRNHTLLHKDEQICLKWITYIAFRKGSKDQSLDIIAQMQYAPDNLTTKHGQLSEIVSSKTAWMDTDAISLAKQNNPQLILNVTSNVTHFLLGTRFFHLNVNVVNKGDESYDTFFELKLPNKVLYSRLEVMKSINVDDEIFCNSTIICELGTIPKGGFIKFVITLDQYPETDAEKLEFRSIVKSITVENEKGANEMNFSIPIIEDSIISIKGSSNPDTLSLIAAKASGVSGPQIKHTYMIINVGPSTATELLVELYCPVKLHTGEELLFFTDQVTINNPEETESKCDQLTVNNSLHRQYDTTATQIDISQNTAKKSDDVEINYGFGYCNVTTRFASFLCNEDRTKFFFHSNHRCGILSYERTIRAEIWSDGNCRSRESFSSIIVESPQKTAPATIKTRHHSRSLSLHRRLQQLDDNDQSKKNITIVNHGQIVDCSSSNKCVKIRCKITRLRKQDVIFFSLPFVVHDETIQKISSFKTIQIASHLKVHFLGKKNRINRTTYYSFNVVTNIEVLSNFVKTPSTWSIVISAFFGGILLTLITYILYKCGFFIRKHPPSIAAPTQHDDEFY